MQTRDRLIELLATIPLIVRQHGQLFILLLIIMCHNDRRTCSSVILDGYVLLLPVSIKLIWDSFSASVADKLDILILMLRLR